MTWDQSFGSLHIYVVCPSKVQEDISRFASSQCRGPVPQMNPSTKDNSRCWCCGRIQMSTECNLKMRCRQCSNRLLIVEDNISLRSPESPKSAPDKASWNNLLSAQHHECDSPGNQNSIGWVYGVAQYALLIFVLRTLQNSEHLKRQSYCSWQPLKKDWPKTHNKQKHILLRFQNWNEQTVLGNCNRMLRQIFLLLVHPTLHGAAQWENSGGKQNLNELLPPGPVLGPYSTISTAAVRSDIKEMFYQVRLLPENRLLWHL